MIDSALTYKNGIKDGVPIALGYLSVSFAFGVTAVSLGVPKLIALFISATNLTSAGQLAGVAIIAVLGTVFEIIFTQLVINARYFLMSLTLTQKLDEKFSVLDRIICSFGITDEIFAVAVSNEKPVTRNYMLGLITLPYIGWTTGTILGAVMGDVLPEVIVSALNIALYAMFIAIIIPTAMQNKKVIPVIVISIALSCALTFDPHLQWINSGIVYVVCALIASVVGALIFPVPFDDEMLDKEDIDEQ
ncbi:MAG: AzlC family ABC transporter permease [Clostridia bacterium]|nr:AzlC family ABC transporter permease [Clostridia bacterium]